MTNSISLSYSTKSASVTQARDVRKSQSQKSFQTLNENDSDVALDTSFNTKSSEIVNERSDSEHKQDEKKRRMKRII